MRVPVQHLAPPPLRARLQQYLHGSGLELGPGHQPYPIPDDATVSLVDQWVPADSRALFYELDDDVSFPVPDIVANLDTDRLRAVPDDSQDFVIASHILEHLAEPVGMLQDVRRVLHPGGHLVALLPDRRRTFDRTRYGTGVDHARVEHRAGITSVDDEHIVEFILQADHLMRRELGEEAEPLTAELVEAHRLRSIHAHCWTEDEFVDLLLYALREVRLGFRLVDGFSARAGQGGWEFGVVLEAVAAPEGDPSDDLVSTWAAVVARQAAEDRWPVGSVLAAVLSSDRTLSPAEVGAVAEALDVVLHRPDLRQAFASDDLDVEAALRWAQGAAAGSFVDTSAARLAPHRDALERWR